MFDQVHFQNFQSLVNVTLDLGWFTALVGPNGCGKSGVLQGMHLLSQTGLKKPADGKGLGSFASIFGGRRSPQRLIYSGGVGEIILAMRASDDDELRLVIRVPESLTGKPGTSEFDITVGPATPLRCTIPPSTPRWQEALAVLNHERVRKFAPVVYLHLDANKMTRTFVPDTESPRMEFDGKGLASVLAWMKGAAEDELAEITSSLRQIVPGVKRIRTLRESIKTRRMEKLDIDGQPVWRPVEEFQIGYRNAPSEKLRA